MASEPKAQTEQSAPASTSTTLADTAPQRPLSKNAQKRLAKAARIAEQKKERRAYEKEKKKEKKRELAAKRAAGELDEEQDGPRKKQRVEGPRTPFEARIVVDLGFDDKMSENVSICNPKLVVWLTQITGSKVSNQPARVHVQRE